MDRKLDNLPDKEQESEIADAGEGDQNGESDHIQCIKPIACRKAIGEQIVEMKWAFNDSLLIAVTESN